MRIGSIIGTCVGVTVVVNAVVGDGVRFTFGSADDGPHLPKAQYKLDPMIATPMMIMVNDTNRLLNQGRIVSDLATM